MNFKDYLKLKNMDAETYFDKKMNTCKDLETLPAELVNCKCCKRHKFNFPTLECDLPASPKPEEYNNWGCNCDCPCRHIARHICREWDRVNEVDVIDTDTDEETSEESEADSDDSIHDFIVEDDEGEFKFTKEARDELRKIVDAFQGKNKRK
tara:strand:- start:1599 stop:2054 length:456 start_codon:yes stop_codon:yes gene_type:complete